MGLKSNPKTYRRTRNIRTFWPQQGVNTTNLVTFNLNVLEYVDKAPNIPGWRLLKAKGQGVTTGLNGVRYSLQSRGVNYTQTGVRYPYVGGYKQVSGLLPPYAFPNVGTAVSAACQSKAASEYVRQARKKISSFQGATFFGEILDSIRMFTRPAQGLFKKTEELARTLKGKRAVFYTNSAEYSHIVASAWIKYQFGIKPLAGDLVDATVALDKLYSEGGFAVTKRIQAECTMENTGPLLHNQSMTDCAYARQTMHEYSKESCRYTGTVVCRPSMNGFPFQAELGFGSQDLAPAAWEMIPWSFMVDYFSNVGDIISAASFASGNVGWTERGDMVQRSIIRGDAVPAKSNDISGPNPYFTVTCSGGSDKASATRVIRRSSTFPIPSLVFEIPGWQSPKWLNIAALTKLISESNPRTLQGLV